LGTKKTGATKTEFFYSVEEGISSQKGRNAAIYKMALQAEVFSRFSFFIEKKSTKRNKGRGNGKT
jgi:hypothetical protein